MENQAFYNTANLKGTQLVSVNNRALTENANVIEIMKKLNKPCTSWEIYQYWTANKVTETISFSLLQNIRRSLKNLEDKGVTRNTGERGVGGFGISNFLWVLV